MRPYRQTRCPQSDSPPSGPPMTVATSDEAGRATPRPLVSDANESQSFAAASISTAKLNWERGDSARRTEVATCDRTTPVAFEQVTTTFCAESAAKISLVPGRAEPWRFVPESSAESVSGQTEHPGGRSQYLRLRRVGYTLG